MHFGSRPQQYDLSVNDVCPIDIDAQERYRPECPQKTALEAKAQAPDVYARSENLSKRLSQVVHDFLQLLKTNAVLYTLGGGRCGQATQVGACSILRPMISDKKLRDNYQFDLV